MDEMRRDEPRQQTTFVMGLPHQPHVAETQVAKTAVDQLRRGTRRAPAEVAGVDERHRQPGTGGVRRSRRADDPATDHEEVELQ